MRVQLTNQIPDAGLANRVRSAVFWRSGSQIAAQILMWAATIIVVRLLNPQDYGLYAMSQVLLVALNFLNGQSFASSLIREENVTPHRIAQVFGILILMNLVLAAAQYLAAPAMAAYYSQPLIADMLRAQSLLYLVVPFIALPQVLLARELNFKAQAKADFAGAICGSATALGGAWMGLGVWTLVWAPIVQQSVRAIGLGLAARQLARPSFDFRGAGSIMTFGSALILCQFFWVIQSQSDVMIAGRSIGPHDLGLYTEALFLALIFTSKFIPPLNEVAFPAYTQLAKSGGDVGKAFVTAARMLTFIAMPLYLGIAVVARPMVATLLGDKWLEMVPIISGLAIAMPFFALQIICSPTTNALGQPKIYVRSSFAGAVIMATSFYIGSYWGSQGLVHAWQIASPSLLIVTLALTLPVIGVRAGTLFFAVLPSIAAAMAMAAIVSWSAPYLTHLPAALQLASLAAIGGVTYFALLWKFSRQTITDLYRIIVKRDTAVMSGDN